MRTILRAALVTISLGLMANTAVAECYCSDVGFWYDTVHEDDRDFMEEFLWEAQIIEPVYGEQPDDPEIVSCRVQVTFVYEDNPHLDTLVIDDEGQEQLLFGGQWFSFTDFEQLMLDQDCQNNLS